MTRVLAAYATRNGSTQQVAEAVATAAAASGVQRRDLRDWTEIGVWAGKLVATVDR